MEQAELCIKWAPVIALALTFIKRLPFGGFIAKNAKLVAAFLGVATALIPMLHGTGLSIAQIALCVVGAAAAPVGVHQLAIKPITDRLA